MNEICEHKKKLILIGFHTEIVPSSPEICSAGMTGEEMKQWRQ